MNTLSMKKIVNAISKVTLKNNLLCIYRHEFKSTNIPYVIIPLNDVQTINIVHSNVNNCSESNYFRTIFNFKNNQKESIVWNYSYNSGYGSHTTDWKDETEKLIDEMLDLIANALSQRQSSPESTHISIYKDDCENKENIK
jgi:hypothetical protein